MLSALSSGNAPTLTEVSVRGSSRENGAASTNSTAFVSFSSSPPPSISVSPSYSNPTHSSTLTSNSDTSTSSSSVSTVQSSSSSDPKRSSLVSLTKGFLGAKGLQAVTASQVTASTDSSGVTDVSSQTNNTDSDPFATDTEKSTNSTTQDDSDTSTTDNSSYDEIKVEQQQQEIEALASRDVEVRAHEQAHASVGGSYAGQPNLEYEQGPDGKRYAVDGEVSIDVAIVEGNPEATMLKMKQVYAAAMAPAEPSAADLRVASEAMKKYNDARQQAADDRVANAQDALQTAEVINELSNIPSTDSKSVYRMGIALIMSKVSHATSDSTNSSDISVPSESLEGNRISKRHASATQL